MLATYKVRAWLLAGLVSLPAMAEQAVSASPASALTTHWEFAGTTYEVLDRPLTLRSRSIVRRRCLPIR